MGMLTEVGKQRYTLRTGKHCIAICDEKNCGHLISATELYVVRKWKPRKDQLTFLGLIPAKIRCTVCQERINPRPIRVKASASAKLNKPLLRTISRLFEKFPKTVLDTKTLIAKIRRKKKFSKTKRVEFTKVLKALRKDKVLTRKNKLWKVSK